MVSEIEVKSSIQEKEYEIPYHYKDIFAPAQSIERNSLFEMIVNILRKNISQGEKIIDIGCGDGRFCYYAKKFLDIEGVDISSKAIHWAKAFNPELKFYCDSVENLSKRKRNYYGGGVCIEVLEHIPPQQLESFLMSIKRLIRDKGLIIFAVPSINKPFTEKHFIHYNRKSLYSTLIPYFKVIEIKGHSKVSWFHKNIFSILNIVSLLFYSEHFCWKFSNFVNFIKRIKKRYWYKYLNEGGPDRCYRLIAICQT